MPTLGESSVGAPQPPSKRRLWTEVPTASVALQTAVTTPAFGGQLDCFVGLPSAGRVRRGLGGAAPGTSRAGDVVRAARVGGHAGVEAGVGLPGLDQVVEVGAERVEGILKLGRVVGNPAQG